MRRNYNKLVRDRIPEIIQANGKCFSIETMSEPEYRQALLEKLVEEALEARQASPEELVTELADIQEVLAALMAAWQIAPEQAQQLQRQRHAERGGFDQRLKLLWTEDGAEDV
jgi:predicted house-cleaning noncanonical NTP pyrophosphatase (MazG superfamily)